uniref:F-box protein At2g02240-like n=1 Tax=Fragaria vesca subsp. vesca TaxID=101020 RepID=UPI0005C8861F|nr:PREDICTED: F-box protein At2g02240-like [Fragaria vesca subsp. vesca]
MAKLRAVIWLEIRGRIETRMLSPATTYKAYLVYQLKKYSCGFHWPAVVTVGLRAHGFDYERPDLMEITAGIKQNVYLLPRRAIQRDLDRNGSKFPNEGREDGWLEMELGEFRCQGDEDGELEMIFCDIKTGASKHGLHVQGIEHDCVFEE